MQCVILAAGLGKRMLPLTEVKPKPLLEVCGKPLLHHIIESLPSAVDEVILVVGYKGEMIREYFGTSFLGRTITYLEQTEQTGTAHALWLAKDLIKGRFLFLFADDIHGSTDLMRAISYTRSLLVSPVPNPERFGIIVRTPEGTLSEMIEKPTNAPSNYASSGAMVLDEHIFEFSPESPLNGEYYLTEVIQRYAKKYPIAVVEQEMWIPVGYPEDLEKAAKILGCK